MPPLRAPDTPIAALCSEVDRSNVIAGGVTTANFPQVAKNLRRSSSASWEGVGISVMATPIIKLNFNHRALSNRTVKSFQVKPPKTRFDIKNLGCAAK